VKRGRVKVGKRGRIKGGKMGRVKGGIMGKDRKRGKGYGWENGGRRLRVGKGGGLMVWKGKGWGKVEELNVRKRGKG
jgi:hypothetical protein